MFKRIIFVIVTLLFSPALVDAQLLNDAVVYFQLDGNVNDGSSNNIIATNNGMSFATDREGDVDESISNDGGANYIYFNSNEVKVQLPITISTWIKMDAFDNNIIFRSDNDPNGYYGYWVILNSSGNVGVSISGGLGGNSSNNRRTFTTNESLSLETWHHLTIIIRDYDNMEVFIDCMKATGVYHGTGATNMVYSNSESRVGADPNQHYFSGQIDEFAIFDRELISSEINDLCKSENHLDVAEENKEKLDLYPVPVKNILNITGATNPVEKVLILDAQGRIVISITENHKCIDLSNLEKGSYFVKIFDQEGTITSRKLIKH